MMTLKKVIAAACVAALLLSFAACNKGNDDSGNTTTPPAAESSGMAAEPSASEGTSQREGTSSLTPSGGTTTASGGNQAPSASQNGGQQNNSQSSSSGTKKPANTAEAVALYNSALKKVSGTKATYSRKMDKATALKVDLMNQGVPALFDQSGATLSNAKLYSLSAGDVSSSSVTESGSNYVITFQLKNVSANSSTPLGAGGYMYFINFTEAQSLITGIGSKFNLKISAVPEKTSISLSGGTLKVTINKKTGKLSKAEATFSEHVDAKLKGIPGSAVIDGHGSASYTLS